MVITVSTTANSSCPNKRRRYNRTMVSKEIAGNTTIKRRLSNIRTHLYRGIYVYSYTTMTTAHSQSNNTYMHTAIACDGTQQLQCMSNTRLVQDITIHSIEHEYIIKIHAVVYRLDYAAKRIHQSYECANGL